MVLHIQSIKPKSASPGHACSHGYHRGLAMATRQSSVGLPGLMAVTNRLGWIPLDGAKLARAVVRTAVWFYGVVIRGKKKCSSPLWSVSQKISSLIRQSITQDGGNSLSLSCTFICHWKESTAVCRMSACTRRVRSEFWLGVGVGIISSS